MNYYIVDDDISVVKSLERIVLDRGIGNVVGCNTDASEAIIEIREERPDIVMVDFLMREMDGIALIERVKTFAPNTFFIMISKVSDKSLVQRAYDAGIEFFINKPINFKEVERVTANVAERIDLRRTVSGIMHEIGLSKTLVDKPKNATPTRAKKNNIDILLSSLGMLGEKGSNDIRAIYRYMEDHNCHYDKEVLEAVARNEVDTVKNVEQRVRRAIKKGLRNTAVMRIEDPDCDAVVIYAAYVFDHLSIKAEMDNIDGISPTGGRINLAKFMDGLVLYANNGND